MAGWNGAEVGLTLLIVVFGIFYGGGALIIAAAKLHDAILRRLERRRWVTTYWNECPTCRRHEAMRTAMYDADLGWHCVSTYETCWACQYHQNKTLEICLDTMTAADIARLVRDDEPTGEVRRIEPRERATAWEIANPSPLCPK